MMFESFTSDRTWASNPPESFYMFLGRYGQKTAHYWRVVFTARVAVIRPEPLVQQAHGRAGTAAGHRLYPVRGDSRCDDDVLRPGTGTVDCKCGFVVTRCPA